MSQPKTKASNDSPTASLPAITVSRETLDETPTRVLPFLRAIGTTPAIRAVMASRGYSAADHKEGWDLLHAVSGYSEAPPVELVDVKVRDAIVTLDNEDEGLFRIAGAALRRLHPEQAKFVLEGLGPSVGPAAVVGVKKLLERFDALDEGSDRKATRKEDHAALATLAKRGIDGKERARLAELVKVAESVSDAPAPDDGDRAAREEARLQSLIALRAWYEDWSSVARVVVKRRDYLIRLGMAKRKASSSANDETTTDPAAANKVAPATPK